MTTDSTIGLPVQFVELVGAVFRLLWAKQTFAHRRLRPQLYIAIRAPEDQACHTCFIFKKVEAAETRRGALQQGRGDAKLAARSLARL
jgi:hypothetical protein